MKFKTDREEKQFQEISLILKLIARDLDRLANILEKEITITRVYDPVSGESGVHLDRRAFDVRDEFDGKRDFSDGEITFLLDEINEAWPRNDGFQTIIHHRFQGGPFHFHVQIPVSTKVYEPKQKEGV